MLLLVIPVLLSGFSNPFVSWTLVPKTPGARHSQGFSITKWGSGLLNRFCTVCRALLSQERKVCLSLYLHLGTSHCSYQWLWLGVGIKHLRGRQVIRLLGGALQVQHWTLLRGRGWCVCRPAFLCAHPALPGASDTEGFRGLKMQDPPSTVSAFRHPDESATNEAFKQLLISVACLLLASSTYKKI